MAKFTKGDAVAMLASWDNKGTVRIRRGVVHSAGKQLMRIQDATTGEMFKAAYRPEHNVMRQFNGIRIIADSDNATLEAEALADGARVNDMWVEEGKRRIALGDGFNVRVGNEYITERHEPRVLWHSQRGHPAH